MGLDRRNHSRHDCEITLTSRVGVQRATVTASNISATGAQVVLPAAFAKAKEVILSGQGLRTAGAVRAQIVWTRPHSDGKVLAGVHFLEKASQLQGSFAGAHLGQRSNQAPVECECEITVRGQGWAASEPALLRVLEPEGATLDCKRHLHVGGRFHLFLPYQNGEKVLELNCQVLQRHKRDHLWTVVAQFSINEKARERQILRRILSDLLKKQAEAQR